MTLTGMKSNGKSLNAVWKTTIILNAFGGSFMLRLVKH